MKPYSKESFEANRSAWKYFEEHGYANHDGMVLHHKDVNMKSENPERYVEWRVEDLVPMTRAEHRRLHMKLQMKGRKHSGKHNKMISEGLRRQSTKNKLVKIHIPAREEQTLTFKTLAEAAKYIGCSRQLVSQCVKDNTANRKAMGYTITLIDASLAEMY